MKVQFGSIASRLSEINVVDDNSTSLTVLVPVTSVEGGVTVTITANAAGPEIKNISFPYTYFDGNTIRMVKIEPFLVPVSTRISGRFIPLRPTVSVILANLPDSTQMPSPRLGGTGVEHRAVAWRLE